MIRRATAVVGMFARGFQIDAISIHMISWALVRYDVTMRTLVVVIDFPAMLEFNDPRQDRHHRHQDSQ